MKTWVDARELREALCRAGKALPVSSLKPEDTCARLEAAGGKLQVRAVGEDFTVNIPIEANVEDPGAIMTECLRLGKVLAGMKGTVVLDIADGSTTMSVRSGPRVFGLQVLPAEELPEPPAWHPVGRIDASLIRSVIYASSTRYDHLVGVYFDGTNVVATDGHRMACQPMPLLDAAEPHIILPRVAREISRLGEVQVWRNGDTYGYGKDSQVLITTKALDIRYPTNYNEVVKPEAVPFEATVPHHRLLGAIVAARVICGYSGFVRLEINSSPNVIHVSAKEPDSENAMSEQINIEPPTGLSESMTLCFNPTYLIEAMSHITGKLVRIEFEARLKPVRFVSPDNAGWHVVMPARCDDPREVKPDAV